MTTTILSDHQILGPLQPLGIKGFRSTALAAGRAIEQAVLQSPEVQAWKKDAERYRWLRDQTWEGEICTVTKPGKHVRLGAYCPSHELLDMFVDDAAMQEQKT